MTPGIKSVLDRSPLMKKYFVYDDETIELEFIVIDKRHIIESFGGELKNGDVVGGTVYLKPKSSFFVKLVTEI